MATTQLGEKFRKVERYAQRLRRRAEGLPFVCSPGFCGVRCSSVADLEKHQRAAEHTVMKTSSDAPPAVLDAA